MRQHTQAPRDPDRITQREAAKLCNRTPEWLQIKERTGTGPASVKQGRERIYSRANVLQWAREQGLLP